MRNANLKTALEGAALSALSSAPSRQRRRAALQAGCADLFPV